MLKKKLADYTTPGDHNLNTYRDYNKYATENISVGDFNTEYPGEPGYKINRIAQSINWTLKNAKNKPSSSWGWSGIYD